MAEKKFNNILKELHERMETVGLPGGELESYEPKGFKLIYNTRIGSLSLVNINKIIEVYSNDETTYIALEGGRKIPTSYEPETIIMLMTEVLGLSKE